MRDQESRPAIQEPEAQAEADALRALHGAAERLQNAVKLAKAAGWALPVECDIEEALIQVRHVLSTVEA